MMRFADQMLSIEMPFGPTEVCVTGAALHAWWGAGVSPQDATGLMRPNAELITHLATIKREAGEVRDNGLVSISESDVEDRTLWPGSTQSILRRLSFGSLSA
jgi:hypothetical protein